MDDDKITIQRQEYLELRRDGLKLECLQAVGVDNWDGYDDAMEEFHNSVEDINIEVAEIPSAGKWENE